MHLIYSWLTITLYLILPAFSGIESASGEDSSGIEPASGKDEPRQHESGLESGSGEGLICLCLTNLIWLISELMAMSLSRTGFWSLKK